MPGAEEHGCPGCGVVGGGKPYDVRKSWIKGLPVGHRVLLVVGRTRRYRCLERRCPQRLFTERSVQVPPRYRLTGRWRSRLGQAASGSVRALSDGAAESRVLWWNVHQTLVLAAVDRADGSPPVRMLGLNETRARSPGWVWDGGWRLSNPQMTSFVKLDLHQPGWLLGPVPGRSGAAVDSWLSAQPERWRAGIEVVALDPSAPFTAAIRRLPPKAVIVVDHWHLVRLANQAVTEMRQRVARKQLGRRGRRVDPAWAHRRLSRRGLARRTHVLAVDDPSNEIGAAQGINELLRRLLAAPPAPDGRHRLFRRRPRR